MTYKDNWEDTKKRFTAWWKHSNTDRPLMRVVAKRKQPLEELEPVPTPATPEEKHLNVERKIIVMKNFCRSHKFLAESFPNMDLDIGPGSMAAYLGAKPVFGWNTVWYEECVNDWVEFGRLNFDNNNIWFKKHVEIIKKAKELSQGQFLINIPDIIENVDILSSLRGAQAFCFDLIDEPDLVKDYIQQIDDLYFKYYDVFYDIVKGQDGSSSYTVFNIWGYGKTAKIQCDFSAMMSPSQFREFIVPSLQVQCSKLDNSMYHLDGPDAIKHLDAILEIDGLNALQWTPGAGHPDGANEKWYPIYDKVINAGKSLWVSIKDGDIDQWIESADRLVKRYGPKNLYILFPIMEEEEAEKLITTAEDKWVK